MVKLLSLIGLLPYLLVGSIADSDTKFSLLPQYLIEKRLSLYKGTDEQREESLRKLFLQAGCSEGNLTEQKVPHRKQPNIICTLRGNTSSTIVIGAHFDHVKRGDGVVDNWSGSALLPSLFQSLSSAPRTHTFVFVGFTSEEEGLVGSKFYVRQLLPEQVARIVLMVNLDTLGLGPTKIWLNHSNENAVNLLGGVARLSNLPVSGIDLDGFGTSDEESFIKRNICTLMVHSLTPEKASILHTSSDSISALQPKDYYDTYHLLAEYLSILDVKLDPASYRCSASK